MTADSALNQYKSKDVESNTMQLTLQVYLYACIQKHRMLIFSFIEYEEKWFLRLNWSLNRLQNGNYIDHIVRPQQSKGTYRHQKE